MSCSAGQVGPVSRFLNDASAPERKDASTLGQALFDNESFDSWAALYKIDTFSIFFVTTAFLGLLDNGSREKEGYTSSVINITSISGIMKLAQRHVRGIHHVPPFTELNIRFGQFCYNSAKSAASHLTKMLATELALKGIPVRVNAIAPGVYESEMTSDSIPSEMVNKVGNGIQPIPAGRAGT
jgi:NAD(P)-dependent dehydrogenase (short-subunit alcohol dehydrogenase family)